MKKWKIISIGCAVVSVCCLALFGTILISDGGDVSSYQAEQEEKQEQKNNSVNPIHWKRLQKVNPDIYAWITIPGTSIDYPVLQSSKQQEDYYLHHNFKKQFSFAGAIYSRQNNNRDFHDPVTILYGHNMLNGTMFGTLKKFENKDFFQTNKKVCVYLPDKILTYQIVAYYVTDDENLWNKYQPDTTEGFSRYQKDIVARTYGGHLRKGYKPADNNRMIALSTCSSAERQRRILQCVLQDEQFTK